MTRLMLALVTITALCALAEDAPPPAAAEGPKPKLLVLPFAALSGDVPQRTGLKAQGMLTTEFKSADAFVLLEAKKDKGADAAADALTQARAHVEQAKELRGKKKFRLADEALQKALASYKAAVTALPEVGELVDTYALASAVAYNTGRDEEGVKFLAQALALAPDRELPLAQSSALFTRVVADARKQLKEGPKGLLMLESSPSNAPVTLDGLALGATPLSVKDVPAGLHVWSARLPNGETVGGVVDVAVNKTTTVKGASASKDPESRLLVSLAQNRIDADALAAAKEQAKASEAEFVVFGALSKDGKGLALDTFLFATTSGEIRRLPRAQFDAELLSAGMEFYNIAGELSKKGAGVGESVRVPSSISTSPLVAAGPKVAEAKYGVVPGKEGALEALEGSEPVKEQTPAADGTRKPAEPKRRAPLKKQ